MANTNTSRLEYLIFLHEQGEATDREENELDELMQREADGLQPYDGWCND